VSVSKKLGYELVDSHIITERGRELAESVYEIRSARWLHSATRDSHAPVITGVQPLVSLLAR
jgi:hypothetical protein